MSASCDARRPVRGDVLEKDREEHVLGLAVQLARGLCTKPETFCHKFISPVSSLTSLLILVVTTPVPWL